MAKLLETFFTTDLCVSVSLAEGGGQQSVICRTNSAPDRLSELCVRPEIAQSNCLRTTRGCLWCLWDCTSVLSGPCRGLRNRLKLFPNFELRAGYQKWQFKIFKTLPFFMYCMLHVIRYFFSMLNINFFPQEQNFATIVEHNSTDGFLMKIKRTFFNGLIIVFRSSLLSTRRLTTSSESSCATSKRKFDYLHIIINFNYN